MSKLLTVSGAVLTVALFCLMGIGSTLGYQGKGDRSGEPCPFPESSTDSNPTTPQLPPCGFSDYYGHPISASRDNNPAGLPNEAWPANFDPKYPSAGGIPLVHERFAQHGFIIDSVFGTIPALAPHLQSTEMCEPSASKLQFNVPGQSWSGIHDSDPGTGGVQPDPIDDSPWYSEGFNDFFGARYLWPTGDDDPYLEDVWSPDPLEFPEFRYHFDPNEVEGQYAPTSPLGNEHEDPNSAEGDPLLGVDPTGGNPNTNFVRLSGDGYYRGYFDLYNFPGDIDAFYATVHPDNLDNDPANDKTWDMIAEADKPEPILDLPVNDPLHADEDRGYDMDVVMLEDNVGEFCAYGSYSPDGPFWFIGSAYPEESDPPTDDKGNRVAGLAAYHFDLSRFYTPMAMNDADHCNGNTFGIDPGDDCLVGTGDDVGPDSRFRTGRMRYFLIEASNTKYPYLKVDFDASPKHSEYYPDEFKEHFPTRNDVITFTPHAERFGRPFWCYPPLPGCGSSTDQTKDPIFAVCWDFVPEYNGPWQFPPLPPGSDNGWEGFYGAESIQPVPPHVMGQDDWDEGGRKCFRKGGTRDPANMSPLLVAGNPPGPASTLVGRSDGPNTRVAKIEQNPLYNPWLEKKSTEVVQHHYRIPGDYVVCFTAQTQGMVWETDLIDPNKPHPPWPPQTPGPSTWYGSLYHPMGAPWYGYPVAQERATCQDIHIANLPPEVGFSSQKDVTQGDLTYIFRDHSEDPDWLVLCNSKWRLNKALKADSDIPIREPSRCDQDGLVFWEWDFGDGSKLSGHCLTYVTSPSPLSCYDDAARTDPRNGLLPLGAGGIVPSPKWGLGYRQVMAWYCADGLGLETDECEIDQDCLIRCPKHEYAEDGFYVVTLCVTDYEVHLGKDPEINGAGLFGEDDPGKAVSPYGLRDSSKRCRSEGLLVKPGQNSPPRLDTQVDTTLPVGKKFEFRITADDPDGDSLFYTWSNVPDWLIVDPVTRKVSGTALVAGSDHGFTYSVTDGEYTVSHTFSIVAFDLTKDSDNDGTTDIRDNCPGTPNHDQLDTDGDSIGEACKDGVQPGLPQYDPDAAAGTPPPAALPPKDTDGDGVVDAVDSCVTVRNADQANLDADARGDLCDLDLDGDGVVQASLDPAAVLDNCPFVANSDQRDDNKDRVGDACDEPHEQPERNVLSSYSGPQRRLPVKEQPDTFSNHMLDSQGLSLFAGLAALVLISLGVTLWAMRRWK